MQVSVCVDIHQSVAEKSLQFKAELSRHNYVTPTSYLELLNIFAKLLKQKKSEISTQRNRTKSGLDKVGVACRLRRWEPGEGGKGGGGQLVVL